LKEARERARLPAQQAHDGIDPIKARDAELAQRAAEQARMVSFEDCARQYHTAHRAAWRSAKGTEQWLTSMETHAFPLLGKLPVTGIDVGLVMKVIEPS
jgi:hypothetical protein